MLHQVVPTLVGGYAEVASEVVDVGESLERAAPSDGQLAVVMVSADEATTTEDLSEPLSGSARLAGERVDRNSVISFSFIGRWGA